MKKGTSKYQDKAESSAWSTDRRLAVITGLWSYFAALLSVNNYVYAQMTGRHISWRDATRFPILNYSIWTLFTPLILFFCDRIRRLNLNFGSWIAAHSLFSVFILILNAAAWVPLNQTNGDFTYNTREFWHLLSMLFWQSIAWNLWMYWVIVGISYGLNYYFGARDAKIHAAQLEGQLARAELEVLQRQLHPHFLFNTLNLVSSLIHTDPAAADDVIADLGALLRTSLESSAAQEVPLAEEMQVLQMYLNIQRLRFDDTLTVEIDIDPSTLCARVPRLILQPLVENAFRHGISKLVSGGMLKIESAERNGTLYLRVSNNGPGTKWESANGGIGLKNTRARLERLYGSRAMLKVESLVSGFSVELDLPLEIQGGNGPRGRSK